MHGHLRREIVEKFTWDVISATCFAAGRGTHCNLKICQRGHVSTFELEFSQSLHGQIVPPSLSQNSPRNTLATFHALEEIDPSGQCFLRGGAWSSSRVVHKWDGLLLAHLGVCWANVAA